MLHIFDVDHTVIRKTSGQFFLLEAVEKKHISLWQLRRLPFDYLKYKLGILGSDFIEITAKKFIGLEEKYFEIVAFSCFENRLKKMIYKEAVNLIRDIQKKGEKIIFATSSFDFIIRPLEKYLGIDESVASRLEFANGKTTGKLIGESLFKEKKKFAVIKWLEEKGIKQQDACFYSDSYTDIPLLEYCGKAVAVNPDRLLAKEAKKRGWEIMRFHS